MYTVTDFQSSLVNKIEYDELWERLTVYCKYGKSYTYLGFTEDYFQEFIQSKSIGSFFINFIKPNFKLTNMADEKNKPTGINKASDNKRFIKMRIDVSQINKDYLITGKKGVYADLTLMMLPNGEVDNYGNLGMIVQDVPREVYLKDKKLKGAILGNGKELEWNSSEHENSVGGGGTIGVSEEIADDLPF